MATVGILAGVLLLLWGIIPAFKSSPDKEQYPPVASVSADDINNRLLPKKLKPTTTTPRQSNKYTEEVEDESQQMLEYGEYNNALDTLRTLMPDSLYAWGSSGYWSYPYGQQYYDYYRDERYRNWVVSVLGIPEQIGKACNGSNITSDTEKKQFVLACAKFVKTFPLDKRGKPFTAALRVIQTSITKSISNLTILGTLSERLLKEKPDTLVDIAGFIDANPSDGAALLEYSLTVIDSFHTASRIEAVLTMANNYYRHFNNKLERQKEFTNLFLPMAGKFPDSLQAQALHQYYEMVITKNVEREREIRRIDAQHANALELAEIEYQQAKEKKSEQRSYGLYGVGAGIATIAFVALLLVLLSIQRYLRRIVEHHDAHTAPASATPDGL